MRAKRRRITSGVFFIAHYGLMRAKRYDNTLDMTESAKNLLDSMRQRGRGRSLYSEDTKTYAAAKELERLGLLSMTARVYSCTQYFALKLTETKTVETAANPSQSTQAAKPQGSIMAKGNSALDQLAELDEEYAKRKAKITEAAVEELDKKWEEAVTILSALHGKYADLGRAKSFSIGGAKTRAPRGSGGSNGMATPEQKAKAIAHLKSAKDWVTTIKLSEAVGGGGKWAKVLAAEIDAGTIKTQGEKRGQSFKAA